jgi:hypothetical protein
MRKLLVIVIAICFTTACTKPPTPAPGTIEAQAYVPQAQYCAVPGQPMTLCSTIPGNIGPDSGARTKDRLQRH